jgi:uncharacterized membrane protein
LQLLPLSTGISYNQFLFRRHSCFTVFLAASLPQRRPLVTAVDSPPGWSFNPSEWSRRLPAFVLALIGLSIATYLTLFQVGVFADVWEPFFGNGSGVLLKQSSIAHLLPIPDAALGAFAYLLDAILDFAGGSARWRTAPWLVLLFGALAFLLGITGVLLVILQPALFGAFCTLCLGSAVCSILTAAAASAEVAAAIQHLKQETAVGRHSEPEA